MGVLLVICLFAWIIYRASQEHKEIEKKERAIPEKITKEKQAWDAALLAQRERERQKKEEKEKLEIERRKRKIKEGANKYLYVGVREKYVYAFYKIVMIKHGRQSEICNNNVHNKYKIAEVVLENISGFYRFVEEEERVSKAVDPEKERITIQEEKESKKSKQLLKNMPILYPHGYRYAKNQNWSDEFILANINRIKEIEQQHQEEIQRKELEKKQVERQKAEEQANLLNVLKKNYVNFFYHFTSQKNLASIRRNGGLYSWQYLKSHNIDIPVQGGGELSQGLDQYKGLSDYVHLSFCDDHPMAYRHIQNGEDIVVLKISTDVAMLDGTMFSDMNAVDSKSNCAIGLKGLEKVNFEATKEKYLRNDDPLFKYKQAEILVKTHVPLKYILNIDEF